MTQKIKISIAYSPDTDDAFMMIALKDELIEASPYEFDFHRADIQELNQSARDGIYDITAISLAAYPSIAEDYLLLPIGSSIGDGYGPIVVIPVGQFTQINELRGKRIAVPGLQTSAYFASLHVLPEYIPVPMHFEAILPAIHAGQVDAGILIHERQLSFLDEGVEKIADLGQLWWHQYQLPLPLGGNAIRRSLGTENIQALTMLLRESIEYAFDHRLEIIKQAVTESDKHEVLNEDMAEKYIQMYVNKDSLTLRDDVRKSIELMYERAAKAGLCPTISLNQSIVEVFP